MLLSSSNRADFTRPLLAASLSAVLSLAVFSDVVSAQTIQHCVGKFCIADTQHNPLRVAYPKANSKNTYVSIPIVASGLAKKGKNLTVGNHRLNLTQVRSLSFKSGGLTAKVRGVVGRCSSNIFSALNGRVRVPLACISLKGITSQAQLSLKKGRLNMKSGSLSIPQLNDLITKLVGEILGNSRPSEGISATNTLTHTNTLTQLVELVLDDAPKNNLEQNSTSGGSGNGSGVTAECIKEGEGKPSGMSCTADYSPVHIFTDKGECKTFSNGCDAYLSLRFCNAPSTVTLSGSCDSTSAKDLGAQDGSIILPPIGTPVSASPNLNYPAPAPTRPAGSVDAGGNIITPNRESIGNVADNTLSITSPELSYTTNNIQKTAATNPVEYNRCSSDIVLQNGGCRFGANGSDCYAASVKDPNVGDTSTVCINQMGTIMPFKACESGLNQGRNCAQGQVRDSRCSQTELPNNPYITSFGRGSGYMGVYCCSAPTVGGGTGPSSGVSCVQLSGSDQWDHSGGPTETGIKTPEKPITKEELQPNQKRDCDQGGEAPALYNCGATSDNPYGNGTCGFSVVFGATKAMSAPVVNDARCCSGQAEYVDHIIGGNGPEGRKGEHASYRCCGAPGEPSC